MKEQQETIELQPKLEDLPVELSEDVKGGPIYMKIEGVKGDVTAEGYDRW